ncbi:T9SS type A sorting domain-containing protein [Corallibacter sp.]|uniref:T9SS type A sorting domain-containing protein n=1 Tax=Corallibacter sp. TaxID=2038084 RepID=UPI003A92D1FA
MKKQLLTLCLLPLSIVAFAQTTVLIPDDAFEAYMETAYAANISPDGSTTDGSITFIDIDLIEDIDFPSEGITTVADLTGVKDFPKLKNLYCNNNAITGTIDVSGLDRLTNLYFYENTGVTGVDVTGCTKLYHVKGYGCAITEIDFSNATLNAASDPTRLRYVYVNDNLLTSINVSGNTGIFRLDVYNNSLTSLDISDLTGLTYLRFQNNDITGDIDVSANLGLEKLGTYNNDNLSSIDLGAIPYTSFSYFKTSSSDNLNCIYADNPSDFEQGGALETAIGGNYSVDAHTNFVIDSDACELLSRVDVTGVNMSMYPNPTSGVINIVLNEKASYELVNLNGQLILDGNLVNGSNSVNISKISKGVYFINIKTNTGQFLTKKLIKN